MHFAGAAPSIFLRATNRGLVELANNASASSIENLIEVQ